MNRSLADLVDWLDEQAQAGILWFVKHLSANDTTANNAHQAGPYIPKDILFDVFPSLKRPEARNPRVQFDMTIDSHDDGRKVTAIWYNNKLHDNPKGGRNETRITGLGGKASPLLNPESTGALAVFAFHGDVSGKPRRCRVWICEGEIEEYVVVDRVGPVEPGYPATWSTKAESLLDQIRAPEDCWLTPDQLPRAWLEKYPSGSEIIRKTRELRPEISASVDERLIRRRICEFELFRSIETAVELPVIRKGYDSVPGFLSHAQTVLQRRKARSGYSLELHIREILLEENLREELDFSHQPVSERSKKPDFLFPSGGDYGNMDFPAERLRMLGVKTTCRDRWRQILNEADRIPVKHLFTLQEGISEKQFSEMQEAGVRLVVPLSLHGKYKKSIRPCLQSFSGFLGEIRQLCQ